MFRIILSNNTKIEKRLNGKYEVVYFGATNLSNGTGQNIIFFKFDQDVKSDIIGNNHFYADGYLYDIYNNVSSNFTYRPECKTQTQHLQFNNVKNVKMSFFDKDENTITIPNWTLILKKM